MASSLVFANCGECEALRQTYEQTTALRLQAEADFLAARQSHNWMALQLAERALNAAVIQWKHAHAARGQHEDLHAQQGAG